MDPIDYTVIATSNGHPWMRFKHLVCCRNCGVVRRADDQNKPCRGSAAVTFRAIAEPAAEYTNGEL